MMRWRCSLLLALLLLLPSRIGSKSEDDEDDVSIEEEGEGNESDDDDDGEDAPADKIDSEPRKWLVPVRMPPQKMIPVTRTTIKLPLECYVCRYKIDSQIKSCLDPSKHRVHAMTCHRLEDKCFTTVMTKNGAMEGLVRGCRSGCLASPDTTCCELNRCNNQAFAMPLISHRAFAANNTTKVIPTTVLFFVTVLLVLQTVVKVAFV